MADYVGFEDQGTNSGLTDPGDGDPLDAGNLNAIAHAPTTANHITQGLSVTADFTSDAINIAAGVVKIEAEDIPTPFDGTRRVGVYTVELDARSGVSITAGETNHVFVSVDNTSDDTVSIVVNTTASPPSSPSIKIAEVNAAAETVSDQWALRTDSGALSYPSAAAANTAAGDLRDGTIVYTRDTDTHYAIDSASLSAIALRVQSIVNSPDMFQFTELDTGESTEIGIPVANGATLAVYRWGGYRVSDFTAPTGLDVELLDGTDTVQVAANTADSSDVTTPIASHTNNSGSVSLFKLRVQNDTGSAIESPGVGAHAGWRVEQ